MSYPSINRIFIEEWTLVFSVLVFMKGAIPMADIKKPVATLKSDVKVAVTDAKAAAPAAAPAAAEEKKAAAKPAAKPAAKKAPAKKATAKKATTAKKAAPAKKAAAKPAAKAAAKPAAKPAAKKAAPAKKAPAKKAAAKKVVVKTNAMFSLDEGKNVTADALMKQYLKTAKDRAKYDLGIKNADIKSIDIYVNVAEQKVYSVINGEINDSFDMYFNF